MAPLYEYQTPETLAGYEPAALDMFLADGTFDGKPVGVSLQTYGDDCVIVDAAIPGLIGALSGYLASRTSADTVPRAKLQDLIDAINSEGGWQDTDTVGELLTQFLDAEGFTLQPGPADRVLDGMRSAHGDGHEWLGLTNVAEYAGMQPGQAETVLTGLVAEGRVMRRGRRGAIYRLKND